MTNSLSALRSVLTVVPTENTPDADLVSGVTHAFRVLRHELSTWDPRTVDASATAVEVAGFYAAIGDAPSFATFLARAYHLGRNDREALRWMTGRARDAILHAPSRDSAAELEKGLRETLRTAVGDALTEDLLRRV